MVEQNSNLNPCPPQSSKVGFFLGLYVIQSLTSVSNHIGIIISIYFMMYQEVSVQHVADHQGRPTQSYNTMIKHNTFRKSIINYI